MWTCPTCTETLDDSFDACWKCAKAPVGAETNRDRPEEEPRCSKFSLACLLFVQVVMFVTGLLVSITAVGYMVMGVSDGVRFGTSAGLWQGLLLLLGGVFSYSLSVVMGLAIRYARRE